MNGAAASTVALGENSEINTKQRQNSRLVLLGSLEEKVLDDGEHGMEGDMWDG